jgi:hypothetical protein
VRDIACFLGYCSQIQEKFDKKRKGWYNFMGLMKKKD